MPSQTPLTLLHKEAKKRVFLQGTYLLNHAGRGHPVKDVSPDMNEPGVIFVFY